MLASISEPPVSPGAPARLARRRAFCLLLFATSLFLAAANAFAFKTVVIDPGHGGKDRGGISGQRYSEKDLALDVARRLRADLKSAGIRTVMTRSSDRFVSLQDRVEIANSQRNAVFVSIHFNAATREGASGIETYYYKPAAEALALKINKGLLKAARYDENRGVKPHRYFVLRRSRIPAVLAECGFLTNHVEGARCMQSAYRQRLADAIAAAIESAQ